MDLLKTLMIYLALMTGAAAQDAELPAALPTPAPTAFQWETPAPAAAASTPIPYTPLFPGDRGEDVRQMQTRLKELGYLEDSADGIYGGKTRKAVADFQENNDLTATGEADGVTLALLYEIPEEPLTGGPAPTPAPLRGVTVPVYYVDQDGKLLQRVDTVCYASAAVLADSRNTGEGYVLVSPSSVNVTIRGGAAYPASVTFQYRLAEQDETPAQVQVPVYYMTDTGSLLYQTAMHLDAGVTALAEVNTRLAPAAYELTSAGTVQVNVSDKGAASPASVVFTFHNAAPTPAPEDGQAAFAVQYVNEYGFLLGETTAFAPLGGSADVTADPAFAGTGYQLVSQSPVTVTVDENGQATPAVVIFTYAYQTEK